MKVQDIVAVLTLENCVVYLYEFDGEDDIRWLRNCKHIFHIDQVDEEKRKHFFNERGERSLIKYYYYFLPSTTVHNYSKICKKYTYTFTAVALFLIYSGAKNSYII